MESTLLHLIKEDYKVLSTKPLFLDFVTALLDFYTGHRAKVKQRMVSLFEYYNYANRANFVNPKEYPHLKNIYPHLMLNKEPSQHDIKVFLDFDGGIGLAAKPYIELVDDPEIYFDESLENEPDIYDVHTNILTTWLYYLWQEVNGMDSGMIVKFDEHGISFHFNDQSWDEDSTYQFEHKIKNHQTAYQHLSISEIYDRVKIRYQQ